MPTLPTTDPVTGEDLSNLPRLSVAPQNTLPLPVDNPDYSPYYNNFDPSLLGAQALPSQPSVDIQKGVNRLLGLNGEERYQTWPERMVRSGFTLPGDVYSGAEPIIDPETGRTSEKVIERAQDTAGLAGMGGIGLGAGVDATLGSAPYLRPALKYQGKIYKGAVGEEHPVPENLRADFEQKALTGEDLKDYNFGFVNHKGQFLTRENALDYAIKEGLLPEDYGKYGALTSTMLNDNRVGTAIAANKPFYSTLENTIANSKVQKATPEQWQAYLKNQPGVKPEELEFSGINNLAGSITKEQLLQHVQENGIKLGEVWKGRNLKNWTQEDSARLDQLEQNRTNLTEAEEAEFQRLVSRENANSEAGTGKPPDITKFSSYQLSGGENYRELLLTLPEKQISKEAAAKQFYETYNRRGLDPAWEDLAPRVREAFLNDVKDYMRADTNANYKSSHWDEPNVLAHIRMNDRQISGVGKDLHIEEIQSDWHQAGRKQGYNDLQVIKELENKLDFAQKNLENNLKEKGVNPTIISNIRAQLRSGTESKLFYNRNAGESDLASMLDQVERLHGIGTRQLADSFSGAYEDLNRYRGEYSNQVPNAPFKKTWDELAFKRALKEAVDNGYDSISWTPGEAQAARYDLSKHVDKVNLVPERDPTNGNTQFRIDAFKNNNKVIEQWAKDEQGVAAIVGKEVAQKLFETRNNHGASTLAGQDLSIGGSGMKAFYDKMLVDKANAIVKKFGGKVEYIDFQDKVKKTLTGYGPDEKGAKRVPIIKITPQMREKIGNEGLPLYSSNVPTFLPVDQEPEFKQQLKLTPVSSNPFRPTLTPVDYNPFEATQ